MHIESLGPHGFGKRGLVAQAKDLEAVEQFLQSRQQRYAARHDELTGLPNRNLLWDSLEGAIRRADRSE